MTAYAARTRPGPPENGRYQIYDTIPDSNGVVWQCVKGGMAGGAAVGAPDAVFHPVTSTSATSPFNYGTPAGTGVTAEQTGSGAYRRTVLTLADTPVNVADATQYGSLKIYDFPEGRILVQGVVATLAPKTTTAIATTINSGVAGAIALGTAAASAIALTGTMADLAPSTAIVTSTTINVAAAAVSPVLAAAAVFDGTATAKDMYLNASITTATDIDADGTIAFTGSIVITWIYLGDV